MLQEAAEESFRPKVVWLIHTYLKLKTFVQLLSTNKSEYGTASQDYKRWHTENDEGRRGEK